MTNLREHMRETTDNVAMDLDRLAVNAQRAGSRQRRRRRTAGGLGVAATLAAVGAGSILLLPTNEQTNSAVQPAASAPSPEPLVALTGRSTVAALEDAITQVADGSFDKYQGQGDAKSSLSPDTYGEVGFTPSDGTGFGHVGINVQDGSIIKDLGKFRCDDFMLACSTRTLPNGDRLRTYRDEPDGDDDVRLVAELWTQGDRLRVVASADNGTDLGGNKWDIQRPDAVLTQQQLARIVTQDYWGFEIPERFDRAGERLSPYTDLDDVDDADMGGQPPGGQPLMPYPSTSPGS